MARRGPQPTPTATLAKRGSWRAKTDARRNEIALTPVQTVPGAPGWLSGPAVEVWGMVVDEIHAAGLLAAVDVTVVALLCEEMATFIQLRNTAAQEPRSVIGEKGIRVNPTYALLNESKRDLLRLIRECGLSPASRAGLVLNSPIDAKPKPELGMFAKG